MINDEFSRVLKETGDSRVFFDISPGITKKEYLITQTLPINRILFENSTRLYRTLDAQKAETQGYLEPVYSKLITKWVSKKEIGVGDDFSVLKFYTDLSKIPTNIIVIAPGHYKVSWGLPYEIELKRIGNLGDKLIFLMEGLKESYIRLPEPDTDYRLLNLHQLRKSIQEVSSLSNKDRHIITSILSPYIGCNVEKRDGIGSSYISSPKLGNDLKLIDEGLSSVRYGLPLDHFGIINLLTWKSPDYIRKIENTAKTFSWNISSINTPKIVGKSDFQYGLREDLINVYGKRGLEDNLDLRYSILMHNLRNKAINYTELGELNERVYRIFREWMGGGYENDILNLMEKNLSNQIKTLPSFYSAFYTDFNEITDISVKSIKENIGVLLELFRKEKASEMPKKAALLTLREREIPPGVRLSFEFSDKTKQGFIQKCMNMNDLTEKKANEYFDKLEQEGLIFNMDGKHFKWVTD